VLEVVSLPFEWAIHVRSDIMKIMWIQSVVAFVTAVLIQICKSCTLFACFAQYWNTGTHPFCCKSWILN
jgi:hypothetical protein